MGGLRALCSHGSADALNVLAVLLVLGPRGGSAGGGCRLSNGTRLFLAERQASSGLSWATDLVGAGDGSEEQCRRRRGLGADWDLTLVHASFSACSVPAWINDTERFQVGEHSEFSISREDCAREGQFAPPPERDRLLVFVDYRLPDVQHYPAQHATSAWLVEPETLCPSCYDYVRQNLQRFDLVMTHDDELVAAANALSPGKNEWGRGDGGKTGKTALVSIIVSNKMSHPGHRLRHEALALLRGSHMHLYGGWGMAGLRSFRDKQDVIAPYMFHVVIENTQTNCYFTEKLLDAIVLKAVPIYWGCPRINDIFDTSAFLVFDSAAELAEIVHGLTRELYETMLPGVERNFELAVLAYNNMSPLHQLWLVGGKRLVESLPSIRILSPTNLAQLAIGKDVHVHFAVRRRREPSSHGDGCVVLVTVNDFFVRSVSQCEGILVLERATSNLRPGANTIELMLQSRDAEDADDKQEQDALPQSSGKAASTRARTHKHLGRVGADTPPEGDGGGGVDRVTVTLMHAIDIQEHPKAFAGF